MARKCSCCGKTGHNSRTCFGYRLIAGTTTTGAGPRLFGVQLGSRPLLSDNMFMRKSFSMDCLPSSSRLSGGADENSTSGGYLSDGLLGGFRAKKKGMPWTEEEHRVFLLGLEKLGKGDWRGISRNYVTTRTPAQVASHAQKYFLRLASFNKKKRRSSLFDVVISPSLVNSNSVRGTDSSAIAKTQDFPVPAVPAASFFTGAVTGRRPHPGKYGAGSQARVSHFEAGGEDPETAYP